MGDGQYAIETKQLTKRFRHDLAVDRLNLNVPVGSVYAYLGRNGAGKTTTIRMLLDLIDSTSGTSTVLGLDSKRDSLEIRHHVGFVAEGQRVYDWMTVDQIIWFCRGFYPTWSDAYAADLLRQLDLPHSEKLRNLSRGMQAKVALLLALAHRPRLLVLDEPTAGLDVIVRRDFLEGVIDLIQEDGRTVFYSTHLVHEVERIADWVGVLSDGRLIWSGPLEDLKKSVKRLVLTFPSEAPGRIPLEGVLSVRSAGRQSTVVVGGYSDAVMEAAREITPNVAAEDLPLEDVIVAMLGNGE